MSLLLLNLSYLALQHWHSSISLDIRLLRSLQTE